MSTTILDITGMTCGHCVQAVRGALAALPGVTAVTVNLERNEARVEGTADIARMITAVATEGYTAQLRAA